MNKKDLLKHKADYMDALDPTEYVFAELHFDSWNKFKSFRQKNIEVFDEWKEELEIKLQSISTRTIVDKAQTGSLQAAKWVAERSWVQGTTSRKDEIKKAKFEEDMDKYTEEFEEDFERATNILLLKKG